MDSPVSCWVNVEVAGVVVGDGPIRHVVSWSSTALLSKAGSFTLTVAAHDPRADLLRSKRVVRCWAIVGGAPTEIGAGIIDEIRWTADGLHLVVSGSDLLAELRYRSVHDLQIYTETLTTPAAVFYGYAADPELYVDEIELYDGDFAGVVSLEMLSTNSFLYIGSAAPFTILYCYLGTATNNNPSTIQYRYSASLYGWNDVEADLPVASDTIIVNDVPFSYANNDPPTDGTGTLLFKAPENWAPLSINSSTAFYWIRLDPASLLDAVDFLEFSIPLRSISATDVSRVMALAPTAWADPVWNADADSVTIFEDTAAGSYAVFAGELVLSALVKIARRSGEAFRLGAGRALHWLRTDGTVASFASSGVRAVRSTGNERQTTNPLTCQIVSLEEISDTNDVVTRVYPYGAGSGSKRVSLSAATLAMPTGYTMSTAENYIKYDVAYDAGPPVVPAAGESLYGRIERVLGFKDIRSPDDLTLDSEETSNQLAQAALTWLQRHDSEQKFYRLVVVGLPGLLRVGTLIRVLYREAVEGRIVKNIDEDFIILSATVEFAEGDVSTTRLEVGTTDALPATDAEVIADMIEEGATYQSHSQYVDALVVI